MNSIIIHDCSDNKETALKGVCNGHFGMHTFDLHYIKNENERGIPVSFEELTEQADKRINQLRAGFPPTTAEEKGIYYATIQKGFIKVKQGGWLLTAYALFGNASDLIPGMPESVPLKQEMWNYMYLPQKERYEKLAEIYPLFRVKPLISCINETSEVDWFKQAFRACIPFEL